MTAISQRGTVRTTSPIVVLYYRVLRRYRLHAKWCKPRFYAFGMLFTEVRWVLVPRTRRAHC